MVRGRCHPLSAARRGFPNTMATFCPDTAWWWVGKDLVEVW
jgi:hypothetical protein